MTTAREKFHFTRTLCCLLKALEGRQIEIELRNESHVKGIVELVGGDMSVTMRSCELIIAGRLRTLQRLFVQGRKIRMVVIPDDINMIDAMNGVINMYAAPALGRNEFKKVSRGRARGGGLGMGRGRARGSGTLNRGRGVRGRGAWQGGRGDRTGRGFGRGTSRGPKSVGGTNQREGDSTTATSAGSSGTETQPATGPSMLRPSYLTSPSPEQLPAESSTLSASHRQSRLPAESITPSASHSHSHSGHSEHFSDSKSKSKTKDGGIVRHREHFSDSKSKSKTSDGGIARHREHFSDSKSKSKTSGCGIVPQAVLSGGSSTARDDKVTDLRQLLLKRKGSHRQKDHSTDVSRRVRESSRHFQDPPSKQGDIYDSSPERHRIPRSSKEGHGQRYSTQTSESEYSSPLRSSVAWGDRSPGGSDHSSGSRHSDKHQVSRSRHSDSDKRLGSGSDNSHHTHRYHRSSHSNKEKYDSKLSTETSEFEYDNPLGSQVVMGERSSDLSSGSRHSDSHQGSRSRHSDKHRGSGSEQEKRHGSSRVASSGSASEHSHHTRRHHRSSHSSKEGHDQKHSTQTSESVSRSLAVSGERSPGGGDLSYGSRHSDSHQGSRSRHSDKHRESGSEQEKRQGSSRVASSDARSEGSMVHRHRESDTSDRHATEAQERGEQHERRQKSKKKLSGRDSTDSEMSRRKLSDGEIDSV